MHQRVANAGPGKHGFHHQRAFHQKQRLHAQVGHHGHGGGTQAVAQHGLHVGQPLGARKFKRRRLRHLLHGTARDACQPGSQAQAQRQCGQHQAGAVVITRHGQRAPLHRHQQHQQHRQQKRRRAAQHHGQRPAGAVGPAAGAQPGPQPQGQAHGQGHGQRSRRQSQRGPQVVGHLHPHGALGDERLAQVQRGHVAPPAQQALPGALVQAQLGTHRVGCRAADQIQPIAAGRHAHGQVARQCAHHEKAQRADDERQRHHLQAAPPQHVQPGVAKGKVHALLQCMSVNR